MRPTRRRVSARGAQFAFGGAQVAEHRLHTGEFDADARGAGLFVEDLAKQHRRVAVPPKVVGEHHRQPEARFGAQLDVGIARKRAIGGFRGREIACCTRLIREDEQLLGGNPDRLRRRARRIFLSLAGKAVKSRGRQCRRHPYLYCSAPQRKRLPPHSCHC